MKGLKICLPTGAGITAAYWRICSVHVDFDTDVTLVTVAGFSSLEDMTDPKKAIARVAESFGGGASNVQKDENGTTIADRSSGFDHSKALHPQLYARLRTLSSWSTAAEIV